MIPILLGGQHELHAPLPRPPSVSLSRRISPAVPGAAPLQPVLPPCCSCPQYLPQPVFLLPHCNAPCQLALPLRHSCSTLKACPYGQAFKVGMHAHALPAVRGRLGVTFISPPSCCSGAPQDASATFLPLRVHCQLTRLTAACTASVSYYSSVYKLLAAPVSQRALALERRCRAGEEFRY